MAEAVGLTASIIAVLQLSYSVVSVCYQYKSGAGNAHRDIGRISDQLVGLCTVLEQLEKLAARSDTPHLATLDLLNKPDGPLVKCEAELTGLQKDLEPAIGWRKHRQALLWPLKEADVKKTLDNLERSKALLNLALTADQTSLSLAIQRGVTTIQDSIAANSSDAYRQKIYKWLSAPDPSTNHNDACKMCQPTTGTWLVESKHFSKWKKDFNSSIWLSGDPGCGKTVLCSTLIQNILSDCRSDPGIAVAYYYFDFSDKGKQSFDGLLRSLITQLSSYHATPPSALQALYSDCQSGNSQPSTWALMKVLREIMAGLSRIHLLVDALDECRDREPLLEWIQNIAHEKLENLHLLMTSRKQREIGDCLSSSVSHQISLEGAPVDADIQTHINERLLNDPRLRKWPSDIQAEIRKELTSGAQGMFRWVACQLDALRKCIKVGQLRKALGSLPRSLYETYDRILMTIEEEYKEDTFKVLQWLAFSARPVSLAEVAEVLAIDGMCFVLDQRLPDPQDVLTICSSLVSISDSGFRSNVVEDDRQTLADSQYDQTVLDAVLRLSHFSVKEYLMSEHIQLSGASQFSVNKKLADTFIARSCLAYLLQFKDLECLNWSTFPNFPLACYAAEHWVFHAKSDDNIVSDTLEEGIQLLLQPLSAPLIHWIRLFDPDRTYENINLDRLSTDIAQPLYYASLYGLAQVSQHLLADGKIDVNDRGGQYGNALQAASYKGHKDVVQLLLEKGADVSSFGGYFGHALQAASSAGHEDIVQLLLASGARVNAEGGYFGNALQVASYEGFEPIVRLLLDRGADICTRKGQFGSALQAAAYEGNELVVRLLLDKGADVNALGGLYGNALQAASYRGHAVVVRLLLDAGAVVNPEDGSSMNDNSDACNAVVRLILDEGAHQRAQSGEYEDELRGASHTSYEAVLRLLLGGEVDVRDRGRTFGSAFQTALHGGHEALDRLLVEMGPVVKADGGYWRNMLRAASSGGHEAVLHLLLNEGAEAQAHGGYFGNALQAASAGGHVDVVRMLLDGGAHVNARGGYFESALQMASYTGQIAVARLLLERRANVNARGGHFGNALQAACFTGQEPVVCLLLDSGADVNHNCGHFGSALQVASYQGHAPVVSLLIEKGAEVKSEGGHFGNALQAASYGGHEAVVRILLAGGADVGAQGGHFGYALQAAAFNGHNSVLLLLLDHGADVKAQGGYLGNALQAASQTGQEHAVALLLARGADVNVQGGRFGNALQAASYDGFEAVARLLIESGADVNVQGGKFQNALQAALCGGHVGMRQLLMDAGATPAVVGKQVDDI